MAWLAQSSIPVFSQLGRGVSVSFSVADSLNAMVCYTYQGSAQYCSLGRTADSDYPGFGTFYGSNTRMVRSPTLERDS